MIITSIAIQDREKPVAFTAIVFFFRLRSQGLLQLFRSASGSVTFAATAAGIMSDSKKVDESTPSVGQGSSVLPSLGAGGSLREEGTQQESLVSNLQGGGGVGGPSEDRSTLPPRQSRSRRAPRRRVQTRVLSPVVPRGGQSDMVSEIRLAVSTGVNPSLLDVGNPKLHLSVRSQGTGGAGDEAHATLPGQRGGAEALLWAMLEGVMLYAPWSLAVLFGVQIWLIEVWEQ